MGAVGGEGGVQQLAGVMVCLALGGMASTVWRIMFANYKGPIVTTAFRFTRKVSALAPVKGSRLWLQWWGIEAQFCVFLTKRLFCKKIFCVTKKNVGRKKVLGKKRLWQKNNFW